MNTTFDTTRTTGSVRLAPMVRGLKESFRNFSALTLLSGKYDEELSLNRENKCEVRSCDALFRSERIDDVPTPLISIVYPGHRGFERGFVYL